MEITFYIWYVTRTQDSKNRKIKNSKFENQKIKIQKFKIQKLKNQKFKIQKKKFALFNQTVHRKNYYARIYKLQNVSFFS
jgi:hypothetical protein